MRVTIQAFLRYAKVVFLASKLPHDQSLVCHKLKIATILDCLTQYIMIQFTRESVREFKIMRIIKFAFLMSTVRHYTLVGILPREADKIMSGNFGLVAIWVTHPLWPRRVPRSFNDSLFIFSTFLQRCPRYSAITPATYTLQAASCNGRQTKRKEVNSTRPMGRRQGCCLHFFSCFHHKCSK